MMEQEQLNVCFMVNHLDTGGAQTLILDMLEHADRPDVNYTVCYVGGSDDLVAEFESLDVEVVDLGAQTEIPQYDPRPLLRTVQYFEDRDFDVIHAHLPYSLILGRLAGLRSGANVVSTHHSVQQNYHPVERLVERATRDRDAATVFVSEAVSSSFGDQAANGRCLPRISSTECI